VFSIVVATNGYAYAGTEDGGVFRSVQPTTAVQEDDHHAVSSFRLSQNYPNPFNAVTTFSFTNHQSSIINLSVYDLLGREVATLVDEKLGPGTYTRRWDARELASGVDLYRLKAGDFQDTKRLILLR
jgi:hypothetical protein